MKAIVPTVLAVLVAALLMSPAPARAAAFLQASSATPQLATDTMPKAVVMESTDAFAGGITNKDGVMTVAEDGAYFVVAAGQVGGNAKGSVRIWMRINGKEIDNSNTEQAILDPAFTTVLVCQGVVELKKGDKLEVMYSASAPGLGLIVKKPPGEPVVASIIFSAFKL